METSTVTTKGQVVIPAKLRKKYRIKVGTRIHFTEQGQKILIEPVTKDFYMKLRGSLKGKGVIEELISQRKKDKKKE